MGVSNLRFHSVCTVFVLSLSFLVGIAVFHSFFQSHGLLTCKERVKTAKEKLSHAPLVFIVRNACLRSPSLIEGGSVGNKVQLLSFFWPLLEQNDFVC